MSKRGYPPEKKGPGIYIAAGVLVLLICLIVGGLIFLEKDTAENTDQSSVEAPDYDNPEKWAEGVISYNGQNYKYNNNIRTYLFLGIDKEDPVRKVAEGVDGGQADGLFLLVENKDKGKLSIIAIHRNTMTTVKTCDEKGEYTGDRELQICLQHGYGDGERSSCQKTVECVSNLFYGIPINGYMSLNMGGIGILNDAVGGVEVTVLQDLDNEKRGVHLVQGETKVLSGDEAYVYVRSRDVDEFDSASGRLERQEQYLNALLPVMLKKITSGSSAVSIYNKAEDYLFSNIDYARLADEMSGLSYDGSEDMYNIPGEVVMGSQFEEFYVDEDGLYQLILYVFYDKVD